jgi:hypothetical protein
MVNPFECFYSSSSIGYAKYCINRGPVLKMKLKMLTGHNARPGAAKILGFSSNKDLASPVLLG